MLTHESIKLFCDILALYNCDTEVLSYLRCNGNAANGPKTSSLLFLPAAREEPQPLDASLLHLLSAHRQLLRPQHVRRRRRGELPQVPAGPGGGGGPPAGGEEAQNDREKAQE